MARGKKKSVDVSESKAKMEVINVRIRATEFIYNIDIAYDADKKEAHVLDVKRGSISFDWDKMVAGLGIGRIKNSIDRELYLKQLKPAGTAFDLVFLVL